MVLDERYVAALWRQYLETPSEVAPDWRNAFSFISLMYGDPFCSPEASGEVTEAGRFHDYARRFGHLHADLDPLGLRRAPSLSARAGRVETEIRSALTQAYAGSMALETGHIDDPEMLDWVVQAFEDVQRLPSVPELAVLDQLLATEVFDQILAIRYARKKRFGSEGADAVLPLLHALRAEAAATGVDELVMGSMHRGRFSILYNFVGMEAWRLFGRMRGEHPLGERTDLPGDVAYHFGHEGEPGGVRCTLLPNPSHLEAVNPVVVGFARARRAEGSGRAMAVVVHTDASVVGQGVNAELLQLSALPGFEVGGAIHVVINNQIGFTTEPSEARSSRY